LTNVNLTEADLSSAFLGEAAGFLTAVVDSTTTYNQWTRFPDTFDPVASGLTLVITPPGDFDASGALDAEDIDMLVARIRGAPFSRNWLRDAAFDFNEDAIVDQTDHRIWVKDLKHTWYGDANLDGQFNSSDMVQVFAAAKYENDYSSIASWSEGDWNGDGEFDSTDMVTAFVDGGYEKGLRTDTVVVPEPGPWLLLVMAVVSLLTVQRREGL
jgi:hypothetical protein